MLLQWKNMETSSGPGACPTTWPWPAADETATAPPTAGLGTGPLTTDTLTYFYEWPSSAELLTYSGKRA